MSSYIRGLDGLRAIAVGTVFVAHAFSNVFANVIANPFGVDLFFTLSGFLITIGVRTDLEKRGRISLWLFYLRRIFTTRSSFDTCGRLFSPNRRCDG